MEAGIVKSLAGTLFVYNGITHDYCFEQSIQCLIDCCDWVYVVDAGSNDGTVEVIERLINGKNCTLIKRTNEEWHSQKGKEKLNYFTNIAIEAAQKNGFKYNINLQADEIIHEKSYEEIRKAINGGAEGYMCNRINLWQSPYLYLDVPQERKPCSTEIIRLAKTIYRSVDDAENIAVPLVDFYYLRGIRIYHMGFVRKRDIMKAKVIHMQEDVFGQDHDKKLDGADVFIPQRWFSGDDLKIILEPLPALIQDWAAERVYED